MPNPRDCRIMLKMVASSRDLPRGSKAVLGIPSPCRTKKDVAKSLLVPNRAGLTQT
jgi:hypothetical protein